MSGGASYILESDFLEDQVEKDVAGYLGYISSLFGPRYQLLSVVEGTTGADAKFDWRGRAFFLQFKRPTGLRSVAESPLPRTSRKNEAATQQIRRFRLEKELADRPYCVYFELRKKAKTATELQHNVLFGYEKPPSSRAIYVCPTVLRRSDYDSALNPGWFWRFFERPFSFREARIHIRESVQLCECSPFLRAHATIVPHAPVESSDHYYSFSVQGSDVAFHSPEVVRRDVMRLSDFIAAELQAAYRDSEALPTVAQVARSASDNAKSWAGDELGEPTEDTSVEWLSKHGRLLRERFGIRQFIALVRPAHQG